MENGNENKRKMKFWMLVYYIIEIKLVERERNMQYALCIVDKILSLFRRVSYTDVGTVCTLHNTHIKSISENQ